MMGANPLQIGLSYELLTCIYKYKLQVLGLNI